MTLIIAEGKPPKRMTPRKPGGGRPDKLTAEAERNILAALRSNQPLDVACSLADIDDETYHGWLREAARVADFLNKGGSRSELTNYQKKCHKFSGEVVKAMRQGHAIALKGVMDAGLKRQTTIKRTRKYVGKTEDGNPIYADEEQVTETPGDPNHLKWWLERTHRRYVPKQSMELTGADGGPLQIEFATRMAALDAKIKAAGQDPIPVNSEEVE